jgi:cellobiose-specific phosphotransferase system component IIB
MCFQGQEDVEKLEKVFQQKKVPLTIQKISERSFIDLYEKAYVLVRPDGHVAWRGDRLPEDLDELVDRVRGAKD